MSMKIIIIFVAAIVVLSACVAPSTAPTGTLVVKVMDQPPKKDAVTNVFITFSAVKVHKTSEDANATVDEASWIPVSSQEKMVDLLAIKNAAQVLGEAKLTEGKYTQIRLDIKEARASVGGSNVPLSTPSDRIRIVKPFTITAGKTTTLTIDLDGDKIMDAAGKGRLTPVVGKVMVE